MKNHLLLSIISFLSFSALASSADVDKGDIPLIPSSIEKASPKVSQQVATIPELLSQKFYYFGEELNDKIQKIGGKGSLFAKLTSDEIESSLATMKAVKSEKEKEQKKVEGDRVSVTVFVKNEYSALKEPARSKAFRNALLAAAYFPEELEPEGKPLTISIDLAPLKYIHRQLADAFFYGHPLARKYLREASNVCNVPLDNSRFYRKIYDGEDESLDQYTQHSIQFNVKDPGGERAKDTLLDERIGAPGFSKEMLNYFQGLIKHDQHPKKRKRV